MPINRILRSQSQGKVVQVVYVENSSFSTSTSFIPIDNTIPQISEGMEVFSVSITPVNASSKLLIEAVVVGTSQTDDAVTLFLNGQPDAIHTVVGVYGPFNLRYMINAIDTTTKIFRINAGGTNLPFHLNTSPNWIPSIPHHGGTIKSTMTVTEILP
jgi:hypothetical protein